MSDTQSWFTQQGIMGIPAWFALAYGAALLGAWYNYIRRVGLIIEKHDGLRLGFATLNTGLGFYVLNREHPHYPQQMDEELRTLALHRLAFFALLGPFVVCVAIGIVIKIAS